MLFKFYSFVQFIYHFNLDSLLVYKYIQIWIKQNYILKYLFSGL